MVDIDRFFEILTDVCNELPDEFFRELHHGIVLDEGMKISPHATENDLVIMGEYQRTRIGNRIVIYYGSFERLCLHYTEDQLKDRIREVVRHEFRHHMENRAGMHGKDSLEQEDKEQLRMYLRREEAKRAKNRLT